MQDMQEMQNMQNMMGGEGQEVSEVNDIEGLRQILASNDINEIHEIAKGLIASEESEGAGEQPDKRSFVDKMVEMHKVSKEQKVKPEQETEE